MGAERTDEFDSWWQTLTDPEQRKVVASVEALQELGPSAGRPLVDSVEGSRHSNMKELRVTQTMRIFFAFDSRRVAILLIGGDKAGKTKRFYKQMIRRRIESMTSISKARQRGNRHMASQGKAFSDLSDEVRKRPGAAEEIDARKRAIVAAVRLNELRKQRGQTQAQLADLLGMTQANVSRIERSDNLYLSTLADYVDALGGHIEINAVFDDDVVSLGPVEKDRSELPA